MGMVFQVPDQAGAQVADVALDFHQVIPNGIETGDHDGRTGRGAAPDVAVLLVPPAGEEPEARQHDDSRRADGRNHRLDYRCIHVATLTLIYGGTR